MKLAYQRGVHDALVKFAASWALNPMHGDLAKKLEAYPNVNPRMQGAPALPSQGPLSVNQAASKPPPDWATLKPMRR